MPNFNLHIISACSTLYSRLLLANLCMLHQKKIFLCHAGYLGCTANFPNTIYHTIYHTPKLGGKNIVVCSLQGLNKGVVVIPLSRVD